MIRSLWSDSASPSVSIVLYNLASSANTFVTYVIEPPVSFKYRSNSNVSQTEPCETPFNTVCQFEVIQFITTLCYLFSIHKFFAPLSHNFLSSVCGMLLENHNIRHQLVYFRILQLLHYRIIQISWLNTFSINRMR